MGAAGIHPEEWVEDLRGGVRVERRHHLGDAVEVAVEEGRDPLAVLGRPTARAAAHEQLEPGQAERVLHVDQEQRRARAVLQRRADPVPRRPGPRLGRALLVRHAVDAARGRGVEERRERQAHGLTSPVQATSGWMTRPEGSLGWKKVLLAGIDSPASATSTICGTGVARINTTRGQVPRDRASSASACEWT